MEMVYLFVPVRSRIAYILLYYETHRTENLRL